MRSFSPRTVSALYGPSTSELRHVGFSSVEETTYFLVSFMNGAPGSSSAVRTDHAGSNISNVLRPIRIASQSSIAPALVPAEAFDAGRDEIVVVHAQELVLVLAPDVRQESRTDEVRRVRRGRAEGDRLPVDDGDVVRTRTDQQVVETIVAVDDRL